MLLLISNSEPKILYFTTKLKQHSGIELRTINTANTTAWQWMWLWATYAWLAPASGISFQVFYHHNTDTSDHTKTHIKF